MIETRDSPRESSNRDARFPLKWQQWRVRFSVRPPFIKGTIMRWEYTSFGAKLAGSEQDSIEILRQLNELGAQGWELVTMIGTESSILGFGRTGMVAGVLKRPLSEQALN